MSIVILFGETFIILISSKTCMQVVFLDFLISPMETTGVLGWLCSLPVVSLGELQDPRNNLRAQVCPDVSRPDRCGGPEGKVLKGLGPAEGELCVHRVLGQGRISSSKQGSEHGPLLSP